MKARQILLPEELPVLIRPRDRIDRRWTMDIDISQEKVKKEPLSKWGRDDFFELICTRCDFYKPEEEKLECAAFKTLVELLRNGVVSVEQVIRCQPK
jgi:hypothetical protein